MLFNSLTFIIFLAVVLLLYYTLPQKLKWIMLLIASCIFYMGWRAELIIKKEYDELEKISKNIILENGYDYDVKVGIDYSKFPTKQYSNVVLPAGEYKALRIIIGEGKGKNWWCVMFPPLCFVDDQKGIIDKDTDDKLREVLTEEEYELISQKTSKQVDRVQIKFKIVEIIQDIIK